MEHKNIKEISVGERIKYIRESMEESQKSFGEKLGVSRDVISNLEYNRVQPKEILLKHICNTFYIREDFLLKGEGEMFDKKDGLVRVIMKNLKTISPKEEKFLTEYFELPVEHREAFMDFLTKIAKE